MSVMSAPLPTHHHHPALSAPVHPFPIPHSHSAHTNISPSTYKPLSNPHLFQRSVLAQLAARLHARRSGDGDEAGPQIGEDGFVVLDNENCSVSFIFAPLRSAFAR